jgi:hypothetical protein
LARNAAAGSAPGFAAALAQHLRTVARVQASLPLEKLNANEAWPETFD